MFLYEERDGNILLVLNILTNIYNKFLFWYFLETIYCLEAIQSKRNNLSLYQVTQKEYTSFWGFRVIITFEYWKKGICNYAEFNLTAKLHKMNLFLYRFYIYHADIFDLHLLHELIARINKKQVRLSRATLEFQKKLSFNEFWTVYYTVIKF